MNNKIYPCIWSDGCAKEMAEFYGAIFQNFKIQFESPTTISFQLNGHSFLGLNGGSIFRPNMTISLFTTFESVGEVEKAWEALSEDGKVVMSLGQYDWSEKYGWVEDKYGVSWQLTYGRLSEVGQQIIPTFMFTHNQYGRAEEAIHFYTEVFSDSATTFIYRYPEEGEHKDKIAHGRFVLQGQKFIAMDSGVIHDFSFSEGMSLIIHCENQEEIDYYWNVFAKGGIEGQCGWIKDKFGVSWQIVPNCLSELLQDRSKASRVQDAFMKMNKLNIKKLLEA